MDKALDVICIVTLLLCSACLHGGTAESNAIDDKGQISEQSPTPSPAATGPKLSTQKEVAQLAIDSGEKEVKGLYSNHEYGYSVKIPEGLLGVRPPSPYPQHGFSIPLSNQPEAQIWVDGSYNSAMYSSLFEAAENDLRHLRGEGEEVEVFVREPLTLHDLKAERIIAKYKNKTNNTKMIQDLVMAVRWNANPDGAEVIYTVRLRTSESRYDTDKDTLNKLIITWRLTPLGQ